VKSFEFLKNVLQILLLGKILYALPPRREIVMSSDDHWVVHQLSRKNDFAELDHPEGEVAFHSLLYDDPQGYLVVRQSMRLQITYNM